VTSTGPALSGGSAGPVGSPTDRRESVLTAGALALAALIGLVVLIATGVVANADVGQVVLSFVVGETPPVAVAVRLVLIPATAVVAGLGLVRPLTGVSTASRSTRRAGWAFGGVAAVTVVVAGVLGDAGWPAVVAHVALVVLVGYRLPAVSRVTTVLAVALAGLTAVEVATVRWGLAAVLELVATITLTVAIAAAGGVAVEDPSGTADHDGRRRRAVVIGAVAAVAVALLAVGQIVVDGPWTVTDLLHTVRGPIALAQIVLPLVAAGLPVPSLLAERAPASLSSVDLDDLRSRFAGRRREWGRWAVVALILGLVAVAALGAVPAAPQAPSTGRPLVRPISLGGDSHALFVAPTAGGPTLVRLSDPATPDGSDAMGDMAGMDGVDGIEGMHGMSDPSATPGSPRYTVTAGGAAVPFAPRPGAPGTWAVVDVPAGTGTITVTGPHGAATVPVTTGATTADGAALAGPDGPECLDALLGDLLGGGSGAVGCPAASLSPTDRRQLASVVTEMHARGLRSLVLAGDDSPRSRAAVALVRETAARVGMAISPVPRPEDGALVLSGWDPARSTLSDLTDAALRAPTYTGGVFLAPWLLTPGVLKAGSSMTFPLDFTPQEPLPREYAATLTTLSADAAPSAAGYEAWAHAKGLPTGEVRLYAAAAIDVMPGMAGMNHGDHAGAWLPGGAVVPLSGPLP
jgi:hypothetical protein